MEMFTLWSIFAAFVSLYRSSRFLKESLVGTHLTVACAPGGVRRSVCGQVFHKFSINPCTSSPTSTPCSFQIWCFWVPDLWNSLRQSNFLRGKEIREKRGLFSRTDHMIMDAGQVHILPGRPEIGNLQRNISPR